jgi:hypothetical protein
MTTPDRAGLPKAHTLRLLLPFFYRRHAVTTAVERLSDLRHVGKKTRACWTAHGPVPELYRDETLPNVRDFLFPSGAGGCGYLRVLDDTANTWFGDGGLFSSAPDALRSREDGRPNSFAVRLAAPGIELFLSPHGAGAFSVVLEPLECADPAVLQDLGYRLSQVRPFTAFYFQLPVSERDPAPRPALEAPLAERLGRRGGVFRLIEWVEFLLGPLADMGYRRLQDQFSVYSVTRFGADADFTDQATAAALRPFLTTLAHVEEWGHVGSLAVTERVLNRRHWVAVGSLGAAHLIADQDPPRPFDAQRLPTVLHKYFIPYLLSLLQRVAVQRLLDEARAEFAAESPGGDNAGERSGAPAALERLRRLNLHSLGLTINGGFTEVSTREVLNQYHETVQSGLRVADSFGTLQQALRDAEAMENEGYQGRALTELRALAGNLKDLLDEAGANARVVAHVQSKVEWLEVFFASYYFTALIYYVNHGHRGGLFCQPYTDWSLVLAPVVSGGIAVLTLKPHRLAGGVARRTRPAEARSHAGPSKGHIDRSGGFLVWLIGAFALWLLLGFLLVRFPADCPICCPTTAQTQRPEGAPAAAAEKARDPAHQ